MGATINGCDMRDRILARDLVVVDHVVALGDAWQKGAQKWSYARCMRFAAKPSATVADVKDALVDTGDPVAGLSGTRSRAGG